MESAELSASSPSSTLPSCGEGSVSAYQWVDVASPLCSVLENWLVLPQTFPGSCCAARVFISPGEMPRSGQLGLVVTLPNPVRNCMGSLVWGFQMILN